MNIVRRLKHLFPSREAEPKDRYSRRSYSQCGEDLIVSYVFGLRGIERPSYIDIGANHPYFLSNTALFYEDGCSGINVEANPALFSNFLKFRPRDINLNVGISDAKGACEFHIMEDNTLSTFSVEERDHLLRNGKKQASAAMIEVTTVASILDNDWGDKFPDFLSLDAEGMDLSILRSIEFDRYFPKIVCVEAAEYSVTGAGARRNDVIDYLLAANYFEYANTNLNAIMVRREFWE